MVSNVVKNTLNNVDSSLTSNYVDRAIIDSWNMVQVFGQPMQVTTTGPNIISRFVEQPSWTKKSHTTLEESRPKTSQILAEYDRQLFKYIPKEILDKHTNEFGEIAKSVLLGATGEKLVQWWLKSEGFDVEKSISGFDGDKDVRFKVGDNIALSDNPKIPKANTISWLAGEIKTQTPYIKEKAFTIRPDQERKCNSVDSLFIVSTPFIDLKTKLVYPPYIWMARENFRENHKTIRTSHHITMLLYDMKNFIPVYEFTIKEHILMLFRFNQGSYSVVSDIGFTDSDQHPVENFWSGFNSKPRGNIEEFING